MEEEVLASECLSCLTPLEVPWIRCVDCSPPAVNICSRCFSNGAEIGQHKNNHAYIVVKLDFPLYGPHWSTAEELRLLDAIHDCGYGNWQQISHRMKTKSEAECEKHYLSSYIYKPQDPLPEFPDTHSFDKGAPIVFKLSDNPPRPPENTSLWHEMGGYSAARCEFNIEYDNFAEMDICQITAGSNDNILSDTETETSEQDNKMYEDLKLTVLDVYRNTLKERQLKKKIVRDYGLINMRKWFGALRRRYDNSVLEFLRPFMRLFPAMTFDKYLESLLYERQLKHQISKLQDYRRNGLKYIRAAHIFTQLRQRREGNKGQRHLLTDVLNHVKDETSCQSWLARQAALDSTDKLALPNLSRKAAPRLNIEGLPGYEQINEAERELCAEVRFVPKAYLDFSSQLIAECNKHGYLRLAQARPLIKIDVNKTRKLYNFLIAQGLINKDPM